MEEPDFVLAEPFADRIFRTEFHMTQLQRLFNKFNKLFFGGKLPKVTVRWQANLIDKEGAIGICYPNKIFLSPILRIDSRFVRLILLHEMAHLKFYSLNRFRVGHGPTWHKEMIRILKRAATLKVTCY